MNFEQAFSGAVIVAVVLGFFLIQQFIERLREKRRADRLSEQLKRCIDDLLRERNRRESVTEQRNELLDQARDLSRRLTEKYDEAVAFEGLAKRQSIMIAELEEITSDAMGLCPEHDGDLLHSLVVAINSDCHVILDDTEEVLREIRPELFMDDCPVRCSEYEDHPCDGEDDDGPVGYIIDPDQVWGFSEEDN